MSIESELTDFLAKQTSGSQTANRDIEVVMHHYGFRDKFRPTYEETAHFTGLESKQRAEQIVRKFFKSVVKPSDLLELRRFRDILIEKRYWKIAELQSICLRAQLLGNNTRIQSLLILMDEIGLRRDYETYTTEMNRLSSAVDTQPTDIIIQESVLPTIKNIYNIVRNAPGQNGVANLTTVLAGTNDEQKYEQLMKDLITNSHDTWFSADRNEFWYVFESYGKNRVRNYSGKLFSVVDSCEIESMVEAYHNDLQSRRRGVASNGRKYAAPPRSVLEKYFKESKLYAFSEGKISFLGGKVNLNPIEQDVVEYFVEQDWAKYDEFREYLQDKNYTQPYIDANVFKSFLVLKRDERPNIVYSFVGNINEPTRYQRFRSRLENFPATDVEGEVTGRAEQALLRAWLFKDRIQETCGLCGETFSTGALVAAHKKPRTECDDYERRDPHIVMPMCVFGCDFLYERGHIIITDGAVDAGLPVEHDGPEKEFVAKVINRRVDERWLQGPEGYFKK